MPELNSPAGITRTFKAVLETCALPTELVLQDARSLSIGQQQRVSLARSLLMAPDILLLDETISALDRPTAEKVAHALRGLCREKKLTVSNGYPRPATG